MEQMDKRELEDTIVTALKSIYEPEIPVGSGGGAMNANAV